MAERMALTLPPVRAEREITLDTMATVGDVARPLTWFERISNITLVRRLLVLVLLAAGWELFARYTANPLLFPSFLDTIEAFQDALIRGPLIERTMTSLSVLAAGYSIGLTLAILLTTIAVSTRIGTDLLSTLTAMFNPLPAIALLPLALLWFGLGAKSLIFVIVHSVLWAVALNTHSGFTSVSPSHGRAELRPARLFLCGLPLGAGRVSLDPHGLENRLGFRLAHAHCRRARVRRVVALGRARLVHFRE
jgi:NitT/TauT family transport system permease protein